MSEVANEVLHLKEKSQMYSRDLPSVDDSNDVDELSRIEDVNSLLSNILECQLEEEAPSKEWSQGWEECKEDMVKHAAHTAPDIHDSKSPCHVYVIQDGTMPAVPENLLSNIKLSPSFSKTKSKSLQDKFPAVSVSPNEYFMMKLKEEHYLEDPIRWLIKKRIVPIPSFCRDHHGISIHHNGSNISWRCGSCRLIHPVVLPSFYRSFENSNLSDLLAVIIHWACQSDLCSIMSDCKMDVDEVFQVWAHLQQICSESVIKSKLVTNCYKKSCSILEGAVFQFGEFLIIGVLERYTKFTHMKAVMFDDGWHIDKLFSLMESILKTCSAYSYFVSDCVVFKDVAEKLDFTFVVSDPDICDPRDPGYHNLNIRHYIIRFLITNFSVFNSKTVPQPVFQAYLDELQWRERFGHTAQMAFWNMLYIIAKEAVEKSDTAPKRFEKDIEIFMKTEFDTTYQYRIYEPPFPIMPLEKIGGSVKCQSETAKEDSTKHLKQSEVALSLTTIESDGNMSEMLSENVVEVSDKEKENHQPEVPTDIDEKVDEPFPENVATVGVKVSSGSNASSSLPNSLSMLKHSEDAEDISTSVMYMAEGQITLTISNLLSVRTWPFLLSLKGYPSANEENAERDVMLFRNRLVEQGYFEKPVHWMVNHHIVHKHTLCDICGNDEFYLNEDSAASRTDKFSWICTSQSCPTKRPFKRLKFFTLFGFSMGDIFHLIYHWVAQTKIEDVHAQVHLNEYKIRYVYWAIQRLCSRALETQNPSLGGNGHVVEAGIVQFGQYCIIGAFDRETTLMRLRAFPGPKIYNASMIESVLELWLEPMTIVVTNYNKCLTFSDQKLVQIIAGHKILIDTSLISRCLSLLVNNLFAKFSSSGLKLEMIQAFLDEIQWRERYGVVPEAAFWSLFYQIAQDDNIDLNTRKNVGLPQISQVGVITPELFTQSAEAPITSADVKDDSMGSEKEMDIKSSVVEEAVMSPPSSSPFVSMAEASVELLHEEEEISHEEEMTCSEMPFPGVTVLSEKELGLECEEEEEEDDDKGHVDMECAEFGSHKKELPLVSNKDIWDNHALTIHWKTTKVLKPVISDCMAFLKSSKETKLQNKTTKGNAEKIYALDEYYFARKKATKISVPERTYVYCCTLCKLYLFSNVSVIEHTLLHADEKRKEDASIRNVVNCPYCLVEVHSKEAMELHVEEVHESGSCLSCLICSQLYPTVAMLNAHMKFSHVPSEMPYSCAVCHFRSSLHNEVLDHFKEAHQSEPHLICPFCLKICSPRAKTDEVLYTQTYCHHVINHQLGKQTSSCPSCSLTFLTPGEVQSHVLKDHVSFENREGVVPFKPRVDPIIVMLCRSNTKIGISALHISSPQVSTIPEDRCEQSAKSVPSVQFSVGQPLDTNHPITHYKSDNIIPSNLIQFNKASSSSPSSCVPVAAIEPPLNVALAYAPPEELSSTNSHTSDSGKVVIAEQDVGHFSVIKTDFYKAVPSHPEGNVDESNDQEANDFVKYDIDARHICIECGCKIRKRHFYKLLNCHCKFSSHCARSFVYHMVRKHGILVKKGSNQQNIHFKQELLQRNCICSCGFSSDNGDLLANHLLNCIGQIQATTSSIIPKNKHDGNGSVFLLHNSAKKLRNVLSEKVPPPNQPFSDCHTVVQSLQPLPSQARREWIAVPHANKNTKYLVPSSSGGFTLAPQSYPSSGIVFQEVINPSAYPSCNALVLRPPYRTEVLSISHQMDYPKEPAGTRYSPYALPLGPRYIGPVPTSLNSNIEIVHHIPSVAGQSVPVNHNLVKKIDSYNSKRDLQNVKDVDITEHNASLQHHALEQEDDPTKHLPSFYSTLSNIKIENADSVNS